LGKPSLPGKEVSNGNCGADEIEDHHFHDVKPQASRWRADNLAAGRSFPDPAV